MKRSRRKTCECCGRRLNRTVEDYWCSDCRTDITAAYEIATVEARALAAGGMKPEDIALYLIEKAARYYRQAHDPDAR